MSFLDIQEVRKAYGAQLVVHEFNLPIAQGEFVSFLGPSGCGKTTMLRMVAGFETPSAGRIRIGDEDVTHLRPNQRNIGMVFQAYALFPNMTVAQNVAFGLKIAGKPKAEIDARVAEMLGIIKLPQLGARYPYQLSGGQQQRVALARALAPKPKVLLLDEPLSALDAKIRVSLRDEIRSLQRALGITTIFVTHDQEEALSISDRIVVMNEGRIEQVGTPFEVYNFPRTRFVASFVGTLNLLRGKVLDAASGRIEVDGQQIFAGRGIADLKTGEIRSAALRPEAVTLAATSSADRNVMHGTIDEVHFLGAVIRIRVRFKDNLISLDTFNNPNIPPPVRGSAATVSFAREDVMVLEGAEAA
ncbi:ABC transporter ATP-binding protein [Methylobrevis albus]|uniref:Spermidine/putrescine import ATP-binding protein PotA n=1 Tax=Methylobrevis albus TaxID=2793297 RepID=A0A931I3F8_9HYPH|nr:ABC transporter ATP-binding protein [Methylobrevis albus]MBH0238565.1 ABC transporter ATP-binding protein [Methylobrevis albus]